MRYEIVTRRLHEGDCSGQGWEGAGEGCAYRTLGGALDGIAYLLCSRPRGEAPTAYAVREIATGAIVLLVIPALSSAGEAGGNSCAGT